MLLVARARAVAFGVAIALATYHPAAAEASVQGAVEFVRELGNDTLAVLTEKGADAAQRQQRYRKLLDRGFALDAIARFVLGRYWRAATPEQREEYLKLFREFVLDSYATRLSEASGASFEIVKAQPLDDEDTVVVTKVRSQDTAPTRVAYRVRNLDGNYKIIDVLVEGVSLVTTQRSEFSSVVTRDGIDGLLAVLRERTADDEMVTN